MRGKSLKAITEECEADEEAKAQRIQKGKSRKQTRKSLPSRVAKPEPNIHRKLRRDTPRPL